jgi:hypothetical protein
LDKFKNVALGTEIGHTVVETASHAGMEAGAALDHIGKAGVPLAGKILAPLGIIKGGLEMKHGVETMMQPEAGSDSQAAGPRKLTKLDGVNDVVKGYGGIGAGIATPAGAGPAGLLTGAATLGFAAGDALAPHIFGDGKGRKLKDAGDGGYQSNVKVRDEIANEMKARKAAEGKPAKLNEGEQAVVDQMTEMKALFDF